MTRLQRTLLGIVLGTFLTLLANPVSREILTNSIGVRISDRGLSALVEAHKPLPNPTTPADASAWLIEAAQRIRSGAKLTATELATVTKSAENGAKREQENGFWLQMQAVLQDRAGNKELAYRTWERASNCLTYNDHQSEILLDNVRSLRSRFGANMSWLYAVVYPQRADAVVDVTDRFGRSVVRKSQTDSPDGVDRRYVTLINADLVRVGSRSIAIARRASDLLEICTYPGDMVGEQSPKRLHLGAVKILVSLRSRGRTTEAARADRAFRENDSWRFYRLSSINAQELALYDSLESVLVSTLPVSFALVSVLGAIIFLVTQAMPKARPQSRKKVVAISVAALFLLLLLSVISTSWLLGAATGAAVLFQLANPRNTRSSAPDDLGPFYRLVTFSLSLLIAVLSTVYFVSIMTPTRAVFYSVQFPVDLHTTREAAAGVLGLSLSLYMLCVPMWSFVARVSSWHVLRMSLKRLGQYVAVFSLLAMAASTLVSVRLESQLKKSWREIVGNEPNYYWSPDGSSK